MSAFENTLADVFEREGERRFASAADEQVAIAAAKLGDEAATIALIYAYAPTLRSAVGQYRYAGGVWADGPRDRNRDEELRSAAVAGLLEAIAAYDVEVHERLSAVVKGYVADSIMTGVVGVSTTGFAVPSRTLKRFYSILRKASGNVYEAAALAPSYEMTTETFFAVLSAVRDFESYDAGETEDGESTAHDVEARPVYGNVYSSQEIVEDAILVEAAFRAVDDLEEDVVRLAYGFSDYDTVSDAEVAHRLGFSRPKVQRVRSSALGKMRNALGVA